MPRKRDNREPERWPPRQYMATGSYPPRNTPMSACGLVRSMRRSRRRSATVSRDFPFRRSTGTGNKPIRGSELPGVHQWPGRRGKNARPNSVEFAGISDMAQPERLIRDLTHDTIPPSRWTTLGEALRVLPKYPCRVRLAASVGAESQGERVRLVPTWRKAPWILAARQSR